MKNLIFGLITASSFVAASAFAGETPQSYLNLGVTQSHTSNTDIASIEGKLGLEVSPNFAIEAQAGWGVSEDSSAGVKVRENGNLGAFAVGMLPTSDKLTLLGRIGYQHLWGEAKFAGISAKDNDGSFAAGVGAQYMIDDTNGIRGDYTRLTKNDGVDRFTISYVRKF